MYLPITDMLIKKNVPMCEYKYWHFFSDLNVSGPVGHLNISDGFLVPDAGGHVYHVYAGHTPNPHVFSTLAY